jgi:hypothetical protein
MNGYICLYRDQRCEVYADTLWNAKKIAIERFKLALKPKLHYLVSVHLAEKNGKPVEHVADF